MLRAPHCLDNRLTDGGDVVSLTHRPRSTLQHYFPASAIHFCYRLSKFQGLMQLEKLGKLKKLIHFIGSQSRDIPAMPLCYSEPPNYIWVLSRIGPQFANFKTYCIVTLPTSLPLQPICSKFFSINFPPKVSHAISSIQN
jgi:hypothetical protein